MHRICHLIFSFETGGAECMLVDIINEQIEFVNIDLIIVNNRYSNNLLDHIDSRINIFKIGREEGTKSIKDFLKLNYLIFKRNYDLIHCHNHNLSPLLFSILKRKLVLTVHKTQLKSNFLYNYNKVYSISKAVQLDLLKNYNLKTELIYNGVDFNLIRPRTVPFYLRKKIKIVLIGRLLHEVKGQDLAINAVAKLTRHHNLDIDFIGDGPSKSYLLELVDKYDLDQSVRFLGLKDKKWIYKNICTYDLLLAPSINEGFGLTIVEAMVAKIPVLVSNIEGPMEVINNGEYGFYFESENVDDLILQIENIIELNNEKINSIVNKAYEFCQSNFKIESTARNYLDNYFQN